MMQVTITERNAYGAKSDRFEVVAQNGDVVAFGLHHKSAFRSEWVDVKRDMRFQTKAALIASLMA